MKSIRLALSSCLLALAAAPVAAGVYSTGLTGFALNHSGLAYAALGDAWRMVAQADFDGNGYADYVWRNTANGQVAMTLYDAQGPRARQFVYIEPNQAWKIVGTGDFNADGKSDLLWRNTQTGQVWGMVMDGVTILGQGQVHYEPDTAWKIVGGGDFAGTSFDNQVLWRNDRTGQVYQQTVTYAAGRFTTTGSIVYNEPDLDWEIVGTADFDADGRTDIAYRNHANGIVWLLLMNGPAVKGQGPIYREPDNNWKIVAFSDYDDDGYGDLLWRHDLTGEMYIMRSPVRESGLTSTVRRNSDVITKAVGALVYPQAQ